MAASPHLGLLFTHRLQSETAYKTSSPRLSAFCGRLSGLCGRWGFNSSGAQCPADNNPNQLGGESAIDALAVNENRGCSFNAQRFCFLCRCANLRIILLCEARSELCVIQFRQGGLLARDAIEGGETLLRVPILAAHFLAVSVNVIDKAPVRFRVLGRNAVGVDCGGHRPGVNLGERIVFVDETNLVLVTVHSLRKKGRVHAGTIWALQIVEVDYGNFCVWVSANGTAGNVDVEDGIFGEVERFEPREFCVVRGDEKVDHFLCCAMRERNGKRVVTGDVAWFAFAEG